jgi:uncharacterized membrane protein YeaQ/YmgE (transglycosylase-associated protein family)
MGLMSFVIWIATGALAGWVAGRLMKGGGFGLLGNILLGILGAVVGGWAFGLLGLSVTGWVGMLVRAIAGASLLLFLVSLLKR